MEPLDKMATHGLHGKVIQPNALLNGRRVQVIISTDFRIVNIKVWCDGSFMGYYFYCNVANCSTTTKY
ncbi:hypothetical protein C5167_018716 [Papaver somniferum]|uniref:Uncharacterized protein n=1 Tax=Papaver somniferum TaxID=3469 RepID=A0A4Y7IS87_PAPSO|nr:hypothetical protein C5167_018716 [Papaver somniferum]